jgi:hypothetical protein
LFGVLFHKLWKSNLKQRQEFCSEGQVLGDQPCLIKRLELSLAKEGHTSFSDPLNAEKKEFMFENHNVEVIDTVGFDDNRPEASAIH